MSDAAPPSSVAPTKHAKLTAVPRLGAFCDVSSLEANFWGGPAVETAWVWRDPKPSGTCPATGGITYLGVGLDGRSVEQQLGPFDCVTTCSVMDAPDVNGDGLSELTVADGGADGIFVSVFGATSGPAQRFAAYTVPPPGDDLVAAGPLQFAFSGSAGASASASCGSFANGSPTLIVSAMVGTDRARTTVLRVEGTHAIVVSSHTTKVGTRNHPSVDGPWCDRASPGTPMQPPMCGASSMEGDVNGDGLSDVVAIGSPLGPGGTCPSHERRQLMIDLGGNGSWDIRHQQIDCSTWCFPFVITDLNADAKGEIFVDEGHLAPPASAQIAVYELERGRPQPVPFPSGSNRFPLQNSYQGYFGAFCPDAWTFWTWSMSTDQGGGLIRAIDYRAYELDGIPLRFEYAREPFTVDQRGLPKTALRGWDGEFCGQDAGPLG